jgi:hypothetical protein
MKMKGYGFSKLNERQVVGLNNRTPMNGKCGIQEYWISFCDS